jgi:hypothetical protein
VKGIKELASGLAYDGKVSTKVKLDAINARKVSGDGSDSRQIARLDTHPRELHRPVRIAVPQVDQNPVKAASSLQVQNTEEYLEQVVEWQMPGCPHQAYDH